MPSPGRNAFGRLPVWPAASVYALGALLAAALAWSHWTILDVVIRSPGVVRPEGEVVRIVAEASGPIALIRAREGGSVRTGDVLFRLDSRTMRSEQAAIDRQIELTRLERRDLERKLADLAARRDLDLARLRIEVKAAKDRRRLADETRRLRMRSAEVELKQAEEELHRAIALHGDGLISNRDLDAVRAMLHRAEVGLDEAAVGPAFGSEIAAAERSLEAAEMRFAVERDDLIAAALPIEGRLAELGLRRDRIEGEVERRTLRSPVSGVVAFTPPLHPGEHAPAGSLLATIAGAGGPPVVEARIDHRRSADIHPDQPVRLVIDEGRVVDGTLVSISPDIQPEESGPPSFRVLVAPAEPLPLGLGVEVRIVVRRETVLALMFNRVTRPFQDWTGG